MITGWHIRFSCCFHRLFALTGNQQGLVMDFGLYSLAFFWRMPIRGGTKSAQLSEFLSLLWPLDFASRHDTRWWYLDFFGDFFCSFSYTSYLWYSSSNGRGATWWNRLVVININVLIIWRVIHDLIPTHCNLNIRGVDIDSTMCLVCNDEVEDVKHLFFMIKCSLVGRFAFDLLLGWISIFRCLMVWLL